MTCVSGLKIVLPFYSIREPLCATLDELGRRIGTVFFEGFQITETIVFINERVLVIIAAVFFCILCRSAYQAGR